MGKRWDIFISDFLIFIFIAILYPYLFTTVVHFKKNYVILQKSVSSKSVYVGLCRFQIFFAIYEKCDLKIGMFFESSRGRIIPTVLYVKNQY